jgi:hypothetical protein
MYSRKGRAQKGKFLLRSERFTSLNESEYVREQVRMGKARRELAAKPGLDICPGRRKIKSRYTAAGIQAFSSKEH